MQSDFLTCVMVITIAVLAIQNALLCSKNTELEANEKERVEAERRAAWEAQKRYWEQTYGITFND